VLCGIGSVAATYVLARTLFFDRAALFAAALAALSAPLVDYSQEGRPYSLLIFLVLLSAIGLAHWLRSLSSGAGGRPGLTLFCVSTVLAFYTHFSAVFWIAPAIVGACWSTCRRGTRRQQLTFLVALVAMAGFAVPEVARILARGQVLMGFGFINQPSPFEFLAAVGDQLLPSGFWKQPATAEADMSAYVLLASIALIVWRLMIHRPALSHWHSAHPGGVIIIASLLSVPVTVWLFGLIVSPIFMPRTSTISAPGLFKNLFEYADQLAGGQTPSQSADIVIHDSLLDMGAPVSK